MAEAFLRKYGGEQFEAYSAGLEPKDINPYTERVMKEVGIDLNRQYSKHVKEYMGKVHFAYLITVCDEAEKNCPTAFPGVGQRIHWSIEDPAAYAGSDDEKLAKFRKVRDQLEQRIRAWLKEQREGK
jgi:arsenate reductase